MSWPISRRAAGTPLCLAVALAVYPMAKAHGETVLAVDFGVADIGTINSITPNDVQSRFCPPVAPGWGVPAGTLAAIFPWTSSNNARLISSCNSTWISSVYAGRFSSPSSPYNQDSGEGK